MANILQNIVSLDDSIIRVWLVSIGFAAGCGVIYYSIVNNGSNILDNVVDIETLQMELRAQEIEDIRTIDELKKNAEFADLIQAQNVIQHNQILQAIRELD